MRTQQGIKYRLTGQRALKSQRKLPNLTRGTCRWPRTGTILLCININKTEPRESERERKGKIDRERERKEKRKTEEERGKENERL